MKISNFRFFVRKNFQKFPISNFENGFSSWKINIFYPDFFSWQGMIILHRKTTPALSLIDLSLERFGQTSTNPWNSPSSYIFSREASNGKCLTTPGIGVWCALHSNSSLRVILMWDWVCIWPPPAHRYQKQRRNPRFWDLAKTGAPAPLPRSF